MTGRAMHHQASVTVPMRAEHGHNSPTEGPSYRVDLPFPSLFLFRYEGMKGMKVRLAIGPVVFADWYKMLREPRPNHDVLSFLSVQSSGSMEGVSRQQQRDEHPIKPQDAAATQGRPS